MVVGGRELIDTLWNVNEQNFLTLNNSVRINRYIMECKSGKEVKNKRIWERINRYIMECKFCYLLTWLYCTSKN